MIHFDNGDIIIRDSVPVDSEDLKEKLRDSDIQEIWVSHHEKPGEALDYSFRHSLPCMTVLRNGEPIAIFGIAPIHMLDNKAAIWLLATDEFIKIKKTFIKLSKQCIEHFLSFYPVLFNYVDVRNRKSLLYLKWCGAELSKPSPYGIDSRDFVHFQFLRG